MFDKEITYIFEKIDNIDSDIENIDKKIEKLEKIREELLNKKLSYMAKINEGDY